MYLTLLWRKMEYLSTLSTQSKERIKYYSWIFVRFGLFPIIKSCFFFVERRVRSREKIQWFRLLTQIVAYKMACLLHSTNSREKISRKHGLKIRWITKIWAWEIYQEGWRIEAFMVFWGILNLYQVKTLNSRLNPSILISKYLKI